MATAKKPIHFPNFENGEETKQSLHPFKQLVKRLTEAYGPSGHEHIIREVIRDEIKSLAD